MKRMITAAKASLLALALTSSLSAAPTVQGPFQLTTFATGTAAYNSPDSITVDGSGNVWVSYTNGVAPDGSDGKSSTVVEYSATGTVLNTYSILGSNDGLKYNPTDGTIWALRNQDGNVALTTINPQTQALTNYTYATAPLHGGGYDDVVFLNGKIYLSASNPTLDASGYNPAPSIVSVTVVGTTLQTAPVLAGDAIAFNVAKQQPERTIQTDPDSLTIDASGNLVLDSQADGILLFVSNPGTSNQAVVEVPLTDASGATVSVDDTSFPTTATGTLLFTDSNANAVYALTGGNFEVGVGYSSSGPAVGTVSETTGLFTPLVSGLGSSHGSVFIPKPAPSSHPAFFTGEANLGGDMYSLIFADGNSFGTYTYQYYPYLYDTTLGFFFVVDSNDANNGVYLYDFTGLGWLYTSPTLYPYFYNFNEGNFDFYVIGSTSPRYFYSFKQGKFLAQ